MVGFYITDKTEGATLFEIAILWHKKVEKVLFIFLPSKTFFYFLSSKSLFTLLPVAQACILVW